MADTMIMTGKKLVQMLRLLPILFLMLIVSSVVSDDHGTNTISYDEDSFQNGVKSARNFVMFYAPWCGHCKNLSPTWDELAKVYNKEKGPVVIAKVDCTVHKSLCADHEIVGFPTLKLFDLEGINHKRYTGKRDLDSLKSFVAENVLAETGQPPATDEGEAKPPVPEPKSSLVILTDDTFADHVADGSHFIKFYAPWCGHCKKLAPTWEELAETFSHDPSVSIAKIDCTKSSDICKQYEIRGYPTLLWFSEGEKKSQYQGVRTHEALKTFVSERLEEEESAEDTTEEEAEQTEEEHHPGEVLELTEDNFKTYIQSSPLIFVKFFAPWCGHCKRLAPTWEDLAKELMAEDAVIAKVDCTQHKSVCDQYQVRGYPTLKLYRNGEVVNDYRGPRGLEDLIAYVKKYLGSDEHDEL